MTPPPPPLKGQFGWARLGGRDLKTRPIFVLWDTATGSQLLLAPSSTTDVAGAPRGAIDRPCFTVAASSRWGKRLGLRKDCHLYAMSMKVLPPGHAFDYDGAVKELPIELLFQIVDFAAAHAFEIWTRLGWTSRR